MVDHSDNGAQDLLIRLVEGNGLIAVHVSTLHRELKPDLSFRGFTFHVGELKPIHSLSWNQRAAIIPAKEYNKLDFADVLQKTLTVWFCGELALDHRADPLYCELAYAEDDKGDWKRACKAF